MRLFSLTGKLGVKGACGYLAEVAKLDDAGAGMNCLPAVCEAHARYDGPCDRMRPGSIDIASGVIEFVRIVSKYVGNRCLHPPA